MFKIEPATFKIIPLLAFCGKSGSGKTYSALLFARGYVGDTGKIVVIDTEKGRSRAYANRPEIGDFQIINFPAPYTPERYIEAYRLACAEAGENGFVIVDSASHEWAGEGGICEMADAEGDALAKRGKTATINVWNKPKIRHNKWVREVANPPVPTILCLQEKTTLKPVQGGQPIEVTDIVAEKNFRFEMTTIFAIEAGTHKVTVAKTPLPLKDLMQNGGIVTAEIGGKYAETILQGGKTFEPLDEIQVKIASCETADELRSLCSVYRETKHPLLKEIINFYNQQLKIVESLASQAVDTTEQEGEDK